MTSTVFANNVTLTDAEWFNDVDALRYDDDGADKVKYTPSGTGAVVRTIQAKLRDVVSVKDFGAIGDGVADDASAITAALASFTDGGTVCFPPGTYLIGSTITIPPYCSIAGITKMSAPTSYGSGAIIKANFAGVMIAGSQDGVTNETSSGIYDLALDGDNVATVGIAYATYRGARIQRVNIFQVTTYGVHMGTTLGGSFECNLEDVYVNVGSGAAAAFRLTGTHNKVTRCVSDGALISLSLDSGALWSYVTGCHFEGAFETGIRIGTAVAGESGGCRIVGNFITMYNPDAGGRQIGIEITDVANNANNVISANYVSYGVTPAPTDNIGLFITGTFGGVDSINGNVFLGWYTGASVNGDRIALTGNIFDCRENGILFNLTADHNSVTGGHVSVDNAGTTAAIENTGTGAANLITGVTTNTDVYGYQDARSISGTFIIDGQERYTAPSTACTGGLTVSVVWSLSKTGNVVTLQLPETIGTVTGGSPTSYSFGAAIPAKYRPSINVWSRNITIQNNAANQAGSGVVVVIAASGVVTVLRDGASTAFTSGADGGNVGMTTVSWLV